MTTTENSRAAVRVCAIADIQCSRGCGTGACKREQPAAAPTHSPECEYIKTDNPWAACTCGIGSPNNPAPSPADEQAAKKPDAMTKAVKQLADWLLTDPNEGNPLCFAGPPEPFVLGLSRVKMRSIAGDEWTLIAGLQEGWLTAEQRASNFWRIAKLEREEVAREEAVAQYKEIRARAASASATGAEGADALAHEVWSAAQRAPGEGIEDAVQRIAAILSRSHTAAAEAAIVGARIAEDDRAITAAQKQRALDEGGATASAVRPYSIPCYVAAPQPAQADARVGLTDEQRKAIKWAARATSNLATREALMALLQGVNHAE
ncbi:hypothetical protein [Burkholderia vietnamiensis]|nr:hypothetical protein [Burkholderia vietnamiensis]